MASFTCPKTSAAAFAAASSLPKQQQLHHIPRHSISFQSKPALLAAGSSLDNSASLRFLASSQNQADSFKLHAQLNEVVIDKSSNSAPVPETKSEESAKSKNTVADPSSISAFMTQVADLVKLVDSRDIMELQLQNLDCEILIRKKEALQQSPVAPVMMMALPSPQAFVPPPAQAAAPASAGLLPPPPASAPAAPAPAKPKSSHPPLKCPMAGTFYCSPAPGAPSFVKVGDKVQKGQVVCIIEAMKLMNEIEADQSGTVVEILAEDGKPVSVDTPLFIIEP